MYKFDIPSPKKDQYTLLYNGYPINVAKSVAYLKAKMKAHRDDIGAKETGIYSITSPDGATVFSYVFNEGEAGNSTAPYHVVGQRPNITYKTVYMYDADEPLSETERENTLPITTFEVICNEDGSVLTDLKLLKILSDLLYHEHIPVMVTRKALVNMATYLPQDKESFVSLAGIGDKMYNICGERFISAIKEYLAEKDSLLN